jgi:hypothetical protein
VFDQRQLMKAGPSKDGLEPDARGRDAALSTGSFQRGC